MYNVTDIQAAAMQSQGYDVAEWKKQMLIVDIATGAAILSLLFTMAIGFFFCI